MIEAIIDAGNWAPTGLNQQCWRFVVVEEDAFRRNLAAAALPTWQKAIDSWIGSQNDQIRAYLTDLFSRCLGWTPQPYEEMLRRGRDLAEGMYWGAPVIIFCIGTAAHAAQECAMVCQNMMLAATALGLGSCCVGFGARVTDDEEIVEALELKENEKIYGPIVVGYPEIYPDAPPKKPPAIKWI
jgi:nitroreductase